MNNLNEDKQHKFNEAIEYDDEALIKAASYNKDINELTKYIVYAMAKHDEFEAMVRSQANNRRRKFYAYTYGRLQKRLQWVTDNQRKLASQKKLRRLEAKITEETALKSLVTRLLNAKGNKTNRATPAQDLLNHQYGKEIYTGDKEADKSLNSLRMQALEAQARGEVVDFSKISAVHKAAKAVEKPLDILDLFEPDENGEVEL